MEFEIWVLRSGFFWVFGFSDLSSGRSIVVERVQFDSRNSHFAVVTSGLWVSAFDCLSNDFFRVLGI